MRSFFLMAIIMTLTPSCKVGTEQNPSVSGKQKICLMVAYETFFNMNFNLIDTNQKTYKLFIDNVLINNICSTGSAFCLNKPYEVQNNALHYQLHFNKKPEKINVRLEMEDAHQAVSTLERADEPLNWVTTYNEVNCSHTSTAQLNITE